MFRICPTCGYRGDEAMCPDDGGELQTIREGTAFPGRMWPGHVLRDQYDIGALVGVGGMGAVYRARHRITRQDVAIKVMWLDLANRTQEVRRFIREARAASILTHPNTVRVFDFGRIQDNDGLFMVMEFLVGQKLSDLMRDLGRLDPERAVDVMAKICKSLEEAHSKGIVHRDLKPDNIFLQEMPGERDFVKVLDFGLAKFVTGDVERDDLTRSGYVVGSPEYMAPEQCLGSGVGPASDLYACGVILYEMLSGSIPFDAKETGQILREHIMKEPPRMPLPASDSLPPNLERLVYRCLAKDPADRPPSAAALRTLLYQAYDRRKRPPSQPIEPLKIEDGDTTTMRRRGGEPGRSASPALVLAPGARAGEVLHPDGRFEIVHPSGDMETPPSSRLDGATPRGDVTDRPAQPAQPGLAARSLRGRAVAAEAAGPTIRTAAVTEAPAGEATADLPAWALVVLGAVVAVVAMGIWQALVQ